MSLAWQKIEVPMGFGMDESAHRFVAAPPGLAVLINGRWNKDGQVNVREGYKVTADPPGSPLWLFKYADNLYCTYSSSATTPTDGVINACAALNNVSQRFDTQGGSPFTNALTEATILERATVARDTTTDISGVDIAIDETENQIVYAWIQSRPAPGGLGFASRVYATVLDLKTRAVISPAQEVSTGPAALNTACDQVRLVKEGTTIHVVYSTAAANIIRTKDYNLSTRTWGADTPLLLDLNGQPAWDVCEGDASKWYIAYRDTTPRLVVAKVVGVAVSALVNTAEDPTSIAILANTTTAPSGTVWVAYHRNATDLRCKVYDATLAVTLAATTVEAVASLALTIGICEMSSSKALIVWSTNGLLTQRTTSKLRTITTAGVLGTQINRYSLLLVSKPIVYSGVVYANFVFSGLTDDSPVLFTVAICPVTGSSASLPQYCFRVAAVWAQGFAGYTPTPVGQPTGGPPPHFLNVGGGSEYWFPALIRAHIRNETVTGSDEPRIKGQHGGDLCRVDLRDQNARRVAECGENLFLSGGKTQVFDGNNIADHGFFYPPEDALGSANNASAGGLQAGSYQVALVWQFETLHGIMRSPPVFVRDVGTGNPVIIANAGDGIDLTIQPLNVTQMFNAQASATLQKAQAVSVFIYRTEVNGSTLYLEGSLQNDIFGDTTSLMTTRLSSTDATLVASEFLYTTGGIAPSWPLPACDDLVVYKNRVWGIQSEDKKSLVFSQFLQDGEVPMWHPFLVQRVDDDGPAIGLAVMDDNLIVFKEDTIFAIRGNGPDRKGLNSDYIVSRVNTPHGCIERRSICVHPTGITFRSRLGLMRLTRQFQVEYFGVKVDDVLKDSDVIACAVALPNYVERLYFPIQGASNDSRFIVYQWDNDQWAIDAVMGDEGNVMFPLSMVWVNGLAYACFLQDPHVYAHTGDEDPHGVIQLEIQTQWLKFAGQQGFKRIRAIEIMGEFKRSHDLEVLINRNYDETNLPVQVVRWDSTTVKPDDVFNETARYQFKIHVADQRIEAMKLTILVTPTPNDSFASDCATFVGMAFDVGIKPVLMRLPPIAQRG